ncbi:MAG: OmpA family protein [Flavobacteriaceae bacterium]|nr:OmpA family protein [Flavobacteriaceae bacterium]
MNKRALHIKKYITTILLLGLFLPIHKTTAQKKSQEQSIQLIVGSYRYELNALILKRKLIKEGFKEVKILNKTNGLYRVSISQLASKEEVDSFINSNNLDKDHYWLLYTNRSVVKQIPSKPNTGAIKSSTTSPKNLKVTSVKTMVVEPETPMTTSLKKKDTLPKVAQQLLPIVEILKPTPTPKNDEKDKTIPDKLEKQTPKPTLREEKKKPIVINEVETQIDPTFSQRQSNFMLENKRPVFFPQTPIADNNPLEKTEKIDSLSTLVDQEIKPRTNNVFTAQSNYEDYEFSSAISKYLKLVRAGKQTKEIFEYLAMAYFNNSQYDLATVWFNKLIEGYPKGLDPEMYFRASISFKSIEAYDVADQFMKKYIELKNYPLSDKYIEDSESYLDTIIKNSRNYSLYKTKINSKNSDFGPNFYDDESIIFASSLETTGDKKFKWSNEPYLDLFIAKIDSLGNLSEREPLQGEVNTKYHESTATISNDGKTMYFTRNNFFKGRLKSARDKEVKLKIYKATKTNDSWGSIEELPFNGNQYSTAHPALSTDNKKLYFSSDMPGSYGKSDIWFVYIFEDGKYSQPINLGPNVNTEFRESFPFVDKSNHLYFSSDGKLGLGGFDIFTTKLNDRGYPFKSNNLGLPVNSAFDDFGYVYNQNKDFGYFSSNRNGLNGSSSDEVYKIIKRENTNSTAITSMGQKPTNKKSVCDLIIEGKVYDSYTKELLVGAKVELLNANKNVIGKFIVDENGSYQFDNKVDCSKAYYLRASNGISYSTRLLQLDVSEGQKLIENIDLSWTTDCLPDDLICVLGVEPIFFELNKATLKRNSILSLNKVLVALIKYPNMALQISSYADSRASKEYNRILSLKRAKVTKNWLVNKGIDPTRLLIKALGEENKDNICVNNEDCSEAEYQLNRKSTFKILKL